MKASAWSGCWAVGTVIPQWIPCPLDATIWEDALALCSRETCLLWLDKYIRIHNTELAISNSLETIQIFLSKPVASCGVFTGWGLMAEQPRERTQMSEGGEAFALTPTGRPRLFVGMKYREECWRYWKCELLSEANLGVVTMDCQRLLKDFQSSTGTPCRRGIREKGRKCRDLVALIFSDIVERE